MLNSRKGSRAAERDGVVPDWLFQKLLARMDKNR
jgi:hypothetical protein